MQNIKSNLGAIQQKFQSLKKTHGQYQESTSIGQVAEVMTYGVVMSSQVQDFLAYVHSSQQLQNQHKINENWSSLNIEEMILFLDKVIKFRNTPKPNSQKPAPKQRLNIGIVKLKKTKKKLCQHHQNKYEPKKEQINLVVQEQNVQQAAKNFKKVKTIKIDQNGNQYQVEELIEIQGESFEEIEQIKTLDVIQSQEQSQFIVDEKPNLIQNRRISKKLNINGDKTFAEILNLGQNFQNLPIQERHQILIQKYQQIKNSLQNKFGKIYQHYRKQMYIPNQSFQKNTDLMVDMRIFLKYYRQFQMGRYYGVNIASNLFKKIAINGLWLDFKKFVQIHYEFLQLLEIITLEQQSHSESIINDKKYKQQLNQSIKVLINNLVKIKGLSKVVSNQKIGKILNKNKLDGSILKKIVEVHTGFTKEDVIFKLNQRISQRQIKKSLLNKNHRSNGLNTQSYSPEKNSPLKRMPGQLSFMRSIYTQLQLPNLRSRQMKKSSIYSSLQQIQMHKQRQKLRKIINEEQEQKYLDLYFKKQKKVELKKSSSMIFQMKRNDSKSDASRNSSVRNHNNLYSLSLPKMKLH